MSCIIIPSGLAQIGGLATPGKTVRTYSVYIGFYSILFPTIVPVSEAKIYQVALDGFCCGNEEFYFLGEVGGYDTILFNPLQAADLDYKYTEFSSTEPCTGDLLQGGKQEADSKAFEVYRTTSRFLDNYQNLNWIREFLKSPIRLWRKEGKVYRIMMLNDEVQLYSKDGFLFIEIEYVLTFNLNQQKI